MTGIALQGPAFGRNLMVQGEIQRFSHGLPFPAVRLFGVLRTLLGSSSNVPSYAVDPSFNVHRFAALGIGNDNVIGLLPGEDLRRRVTDRAYGLGSRFHETIPPAIDRFEVAGHFVRGNIQTDSFVVDGLRPVPFCDCGLFRVPGYGRDVAGLAGDALVVLVQIGSLGSFMRRLCMAIGASHFHIQ